MGWLGSAAYHTVAALGTNGFGTDELMSAFWAGVRNIKDMTAIHSMPPPDAWNVIANSFRRAQKPKGDP